MRRNSRSTVGRRIVGWRWASQRVVARATGSPNVWVGHDGCWQRLSVGHKVSNSAQIGHCSKSTMVEVQDVVAGSMTAMGSAMTFGNTPQPAAGSWRRLWWCKLVRVLKMDGRREIDEWRRWRSGADDEGGNGCSHEGMERGERTRQLASPRVVLST